MGQEGRARGRKQTMGDVHSWLCYRRGPEGEVDDPC